MDPSKPSEYTHSIEAKTMHFMRTTYTLRTGLLLDAVLFAIHAENPYAQHENQRRADTRSTARPERRANSTAESELFLCKTPTGASRTSEGGRFQDGWFHVIWKWNRSRPICAWECGIGMGWVGKSTSQ